VAVTALLELQLKPDDLEKSYQVLKEILTDTRAFDGCLGVDVLIDNADPAHLVVHETWASVEQDNAYRAWRAGQADSPLGALLAGAPTLTILTKSSDI
jgi:quinol monooxygenase YgiN